MQNVVLMITIAKRNMSEEYISYFEKTKGKIDAAAIRDIDISEYQKEE